VKSINFRKYAAPQIPKRKNTMNIPDPENTEQVAEYIRYARGKLGEMWGIGRPLHNSELGRALGLKGRDPGEAVLDWQGSSSTRKISGPVLVALEAMLDGFVPVYALEAFRKHDGSIAIPPVAVFDAVMARAQKQRPQQ
jgi:hypothetical protein